MDPPSTAHRLQRAFIYARATPGATDWLVGGCIGLKMLKQGFPRSTPLNSGDDTASRPHKMRRRVAAPRGGCAVQPRTPR